MAQTIQQKISLVGGTEVAAQLSALGTAGEAAAAKLRTSFAGAGGFGAQISSAIAQTRARFVEFAAAGTEIGKSFVETGAKAREFGSAVVEVGKKVVETAAIIGGLEFGLGKLVKSSVEAVSGTQRLADATGISTEQLQKLQFTAAAKGLEGGALDGILAKLNLAFQKFGEGAKQADDGIRVYKDLGITVIRANKESEARIATQQKLNKATADGNDELKNAATALKSIGFKDQDNLHANLLELATDFGKITDAQQRFALEAKLVGTRGNAVAFDALLRSLKALEPEFDKTGAKFDEFDKKMAEEGELAFAKLEASVTGLKDKIGTALVPAFATFADKLSEFLAKNSTAIREWATAIAEKAVPVIKDLFNAFAGRDGEVQDKAILQLRDNVVGFAIGARQVIVGLIAVFNALGTAINVLLTPINALLGTNLTAGVVGVTIAALQFLGVINLLIAAAPLLGAAFAAAGAIIAVIFTPGGLIAAGIGAVAGLIIAFWPQIRQGAEALWTDLVAGFNGVVAGITALFQNLVSFIGGVVNTVSSWISSLIADAQALAATIGAAVTGNLTSPEAHAGGGYIRGGGTGTSDSIIARLSNGEFVMSAAAVRHWGVGMMAAMNQLRGFSFGGLVESLGSSLSAGFAAPRYGGGGIAVASGGGMGGRPVHLAIGNQTFVLAGPEQTVANLISAASRSQLLAAGKAPWWRGR